jgi:uncharacterized protein with FMN-binding domain
MKRLAILLVATAAVVVLLVGIRTGDRPEAHPPPTIVPSHRASRPAASASPIEPARPEYRSGTAVGSAHTDYGNVRLRVVTEHGRIEEVRVLEVPHANRIDRELSAPAVRTLTHQVLRIQSADVDLVSGATYTSDGYVRSLQAALDQLS